MVKRQTKSPSYLIWTPYGYYFRLRVAADLRQHLGIKTELRFHILKEIRKIRRKPRSGKRRLTYNEVADRLNEKGYKTVTGKAFTSSIIRNTLQRAKV
jgi:hypothetical protein